MFKKSTISTLAVILFAMGLLSSSLFAYDSYKEVLIDLSSQRAYAIEDGFIVFEGRISSGKPGRETPTGEFKITQKKRHHKSNLWPKPNGGAKMPYMLRLTNTGISMHLGSVPNRAASHGCVRLKNGFAQKMFRWASVGTYVYIDGDARDYLVDIEGNYHDNYGITNINY